MEQFQKEHDLFPVTITDKSELSHGSFILSWEKEVPFRAGQVIKISVDNETPPRIYSICSGSEDEKMSILFDIKQQGFLSPRLAAMKPGDTILVSHPYGTFICDLAPSYWIATGTGIAPFYSMFRSGFGENKILIHGARNLNQFYFDKEFEKEFGENYVRCCTNEQSPDVYPGRITEYLSKLENPPKDFIYYLCGGGMMVIDVRDLLIEKGIPYEHIVSEIYF
jgi:ferredoxin--NADP+ reductase